MDPGYRVLQGPRRRRDRDQGQRRHLPAAVGGGAAHPFGRSPSIPAVPHRGIRLRPRRLDRRRDDPVPAHLGPRPRDRHPALRRGGERPCDS